MEYEKEFVTLLDLFVELDHSVFTAWHSRHMSPRQEPVSFNDPQTLILSSTTSFQHPTSAGRLLSGLYACKDPCR